jgi:hypothetical protein
MMVTSKRSTLVTARHTTGHDEASNPHLEAFKERVLRVFEGLAKGALAVVLYGSGALVLSGVLFYFSWKLGIAALFVLGGLLPLGASAYLLWRLVRRERPPRLWRRGLRQAAILKLARRLGGRLTVADVALGTGLSLGEAKAALNELARKGYVGLEVSPSGVLVYHCFPLAEIQDKRRAEQLLP